jgi:hypothetical protein
MLLLALMHQQHQQAVALGVKRQARMNERAENPRFHFATASHALLGLWKSQFYPPQQQQLLVHREQTNEAAACSWMTWVC